MQGKIPIALQNEIGEQTIDFLVKAERTEMPGVAKGIIFLGLFFLSPFIIFVCLVVYYFLFDIRQGMEMLIGIVPIFPFLLIGGWIFLLGMKFLTERGGYFVGLEHYLIKYHRGKIEKIAWSDFSGSMNLEEHDALGYLELEFRSKDDKAQKYVAKTVCLAGIPNVYEVEQKCRQRILGVEPFSKGTEASSAHLPPALIRVIDSEEVDFVVLAKRQEDPMPVFGLVAMGSIWTIGLIAFSWDIRLFDFYDAEGHLILWERLTSLFFLALFFLPGVLPIWYGLHLYYKKGGYFVGTPTRLIQYRAGKLAATSWGQFTGKVFVSLSSHSLTFTLRTGYNYTNRHGFQKRFQPNSIYMRGIPNLREIEKKCKHRIAEWKRGLV